MSRRYEEAIAAAQAAVSRKNLPDARAAYETALAIRPSFVPLLFEHAKLCQKTGDAEAARASLRRVLLLEPGHRQALGLLSLLSLSSQSQDDRELVRRIKAMAPKTARGGVLRRLLPGLGAGGAARPDTRGMSGAQKRRFLAAAEAVALGDYPAAIPRLETLARERPADERVLLALADAALAHFSGATVLDRLARAVEAAPGSAALRARLIRAAAQAERFELADSLLSDLAPAERETADGLLAEATVRYHNEDWAGALDCLDRLDALGDGRADGAALRALILAESGRFDEAAPAFDDWARLAPNAPRLLMRASATRVLARGTPLFERALAAAGDPRLSQACRAAANFALVRAHKAAGDREAEFDCLLTANALVDALYDPVEEEARIAAIRRHVTPGICRHGGGETGDGADGARGAGLVFVCGLPRSGSTLVAQILAAHPEAVSIGESALFHQCLEAARARGYPEDIAAFGEADFAELGRQYLDALPKFAREARFVIDKELSKYQHLGLLARMLPGARIVLTRRDHMDSCYSMYCQIFPGWPSAIYDQENLAHLAALHDRICAHWAEALAPAPHELRYESLVADTEAEIRRLLDAVNMPFHEDCLNFQQAKTTVRTASSYQVRQKIYSGSIGAWRRHAEGLRPLRDRLEALGVATADPEEPSGT